MITELFGVPGSGKTTFCKKFSVEYNCKDIMKFYRDNIFGRILYHAFIHSFFLRPSINKKIKMILKQLESKKYINQLNNKIDIGTYVKYMGFVYYFESNKKNIVVDEGIVHYCMALYAEFGVNFDILKYIIEVFNVSNIRYCVIARDVDTVLFQIQERARKRSPIDFLNNQQLKDILNKYKVAEKYFYDMLINKCKLYDTSKKGVIGIESEN